MHPFPDDNMTWPTRPGQNAARGARRTSRRPRMFEAVRPLACVAVVVFCGAACEARTRRTPDDTVVVLIDTPINSTDPRAMLSNYDGKVSKLIASGLTAVATPTLLPRLELAAKIEHVNDLTVDVTVRDDARFSDGSPVTADDVVGTYASVLAPDSTSSSHKTLADRLTGVEAVAPRIARFHLKTPLATFASDLDFGIVSFHHGPPDTHHVIGAGPYQLSSQ